MFTFKSANSFNSKWQKSVFLQDIRVRCYCGFPGEFGGYRKEAKKVTNVL